MMIQPDTKLQCANCGCVGQGKYCFECGQKFIISKITLHSIAHEILHYFTHLDKGFGYTIKKLLIHPGRMQKEYIAGKRSRYQKPFSMFFLCGTICGLAYFFINLSYRHLYNTTDTAEENFFRHYFVLVQAALLPFYTFLIWLIFLGSKKNYAEILVMMLYNLSIVFLVLIPINTLKLLGTNFDLKYIEVIFLMLYNLATNLSFFREAKGWIVVKTLIAMGACYVISQVAISLVIEYVR